MEERSDLQTAAVVQPPSDSVLLISVVLPISVALLIAVVLPIFVALPIVAALLIVVALPIAAAPLVVAAAQLVVAAAELVVAAAQRSAAVEVVAASPAPQQPPVLSAVAPQQLSAGAALQERAVTGSGQEKATPWLLQRPPQTAAARSREATVDQDNPRTTDQRGPGSAQVEKRQCFDNSDPGADFLGAEDSAALVADSCGRLETAAGSPELDSSAG